MNKKNIYLFKNTGIFFISSFATKILSFLFIPLYTSVLSTADYGTADLISTTTTLLVYIFTLNIGDSVLRFAIEDRKNAYTYFSFGIRTILFGTIVCAICITLFSCFSFFVLESYFYRFLFVYFILSSIHNLVSSYARGIDKVKQVGIAGVVSSVIAISCNIVLLVVARIGLVGYLLSHVLSTISAVIYLWVSLKISINKLIFGDKCEAVIKKRMVAYSVPLIFNGVAWWLNSAFDRYSITYLMGVDQNGLYSVASKIPLIIATINSIFGQAWSLSAIKDVDENDDDGFFSRTYNMYNFVLVCIGAFLIAINIPLAKLLFAKDFFYAWQYSSILIMSAIFNALSSFLGGAFTKVMRTDIYAKTTVFGTVINIGLNIVLIKLIGMIGAAIATTTCFISMWGIRYYVAKRIVKMDVAFFRHFISYILIVIQICLEHCFHRFTFIQVGLFAVILLIYKKEMLFVLSILMKGIKRKQYK